MDFWLKELLSSFSFNGISKHHNMHQYVDISLFLQWSNIRLRLQIWSIRNFFSNALCKFHVHGNNFVFRINDFVSHDFKAVSVAYNSCSGYGFIADCFYIFRKFSRSSRPPRILCLYWIHFYRTRSVPDFGRTVYVPKSTKKRVNIIEGSTGSLALT